MEAGGLSLIKCDRQMCTYLQILTIPFFLLTQNSPPAFCPDSRTKDLDAVLSVVRQAEQFIHVALMEYFPASKFFYHHR